MPIELYKAVLRTGHMLSATADFAIKSVMLVLQWVIPHLIDLPSLVFSASSFP